LTLAALPPLEGHGVTGGGFYLSHSRRMLSPVAVTVAVRTPFGARTEVSKPDKTRADLNSIFGGGRGIRTPEGLHLSGFQDHRHRPLGHPSGDHNDTCGLATKDSLQEGHSDFSSGHAIRQETLREWIDGDSLRVSEPW